MTLKNWIIAILFIIPFPLSLCAEIEESDEQYEKYVYEIVDSFAETMEEEFNLQLIKWGGIFHDYFDRGIEFNAFRHATLDEARALELAAIDRVAKTIQAHQCIQPYLEKYSIDPESIWVSIRFVQPNHRGYADGSIDQVSNMPSSNDSQKRDLWFESENPFDDKYRHNDDDKSFKSLIIETFEDAVKLNARSSFKDLGTHESTEFEDELNQIFALFEKEMKIRRHIYFDSIGWMVSGKKSSDIREIRASCRISHRASQEEARALMLFASQRLLYALNNSETLKPYLKEYPFPAGRLKLRMLFRKEKHFVGQVPFYDGTMESVVLNENMLTYNHYIANSEHEDWHQLVTCGNESYQEAQKLHEEKPSSTFMEKIRNIGRDIYDGITFFFEGIIIKFFLILFSLFLN